MPWIYIPALSPEDWRRFLAEPDTQWRIGFSARAVAHAWQEAAGFPSEVAALLDSASDINLRRAQLLFAFPEHKVHFPPSDARPSQSDVFALAKSVNGQLISIAVEAKVSEPFAQTVDEWSHGSTGGKEERLGFLTAKLGLANKQVGHIRYQLMHRMVSAVLEAERFNAGYALLVVQSFSQSDEWFGDFREFVSLYGQTAEVGKLVELGESDKVPMLAGWAKGSAKYLDA